MRKITFASCGLSKKHNFLQAPRCDCGCGGYGNLMLNTKQDLYDFMGSMLEEHDCEHCAIFAINANDSVVMAIKLSDGIQIYGSSGMATGLIADVQEEFQFHCYGLLEQVDVNLYRIVMD